MKLLNRLTLKSMKLNRKRTIVTIMGVLLATAMITTVSILVTSARASLVAYEIENRGKYHYSFDNVDSESLKYISENRQVESWYAIKQLGYAKLPESKNEYKPYLRILAADKQALADAPLKLVEGRLPENESEIVIAKHIRSNGGVDYQIGDQLSLDIGKRKYIEGYEGISGEYLPGEESLTKEFYREYTIVGVIERPDMRLEPYSEAGYTVFTYLEDEDICEGADIYVYFTREGLKHYEQAAEELADVCGLGFNCNEDLLRYQVLAISDSIMGMLLSVAAVVIVIIMFTGIFCIRNSFSISITEKMKQYGMLASVGATSKQIRRNVFFEAACLALIGIPLGILSGLLASFLLIFVCNRFWGDGLFINLVFSVSVFPILAAAVLSYVTILISARSSARRAAKVSPMEAIRGTTEVAVNARKVRSPKWIKHCFGIGGELADKNLRRSRKKYRTTVISIVVSVSLFIAMWSFIDMAFGTLGIYYQEGTYNVEVDLSEKATADRMEQTIKENGTVEKYTYLKGRTLEVPAENVVLGNEYKKAMNIEEPDDSWYLSVLSLGEAEYASYLKLLGLKETETEGKAILFSTCNIRVEKENGKEVYQTVQVFGYQKGDEISGRLAQKEISLEVAAVADVKPLGLDGLYDFLIVSDKTLERLDDSGEVSASFYILSDDADQLTEDIQKEFETDLINVYNRDAQAKEEKSLFMVFAIFLYGFIGVISLIGVTNIFNTITTNMELRSREFAMLKSIGMTKREFTRMIRLESILYCGKSLLIGIPLGIALSLLIYRAFMEGAELGYTVPWGGILIAAAAVLLLIAGIMRYSMNRINRQNIIETIRNENI